MCSWKTNEKIKRSHNNGHRPELRSGFRWLVEQHVVEIGSLDLKCHFRSLAVAVMARRKHPQRETM